MRLFMRRTFWWAAGLSLSQLVCTTLAAQTPADPPPSVTSSNPAKAVASPPPLPAAKCPVDFFRELLAMNLEERKQYLSDRPLETQKLILAKVREYESLQPNQRELRLKATELRYYLRPLLNTPATNRAAQVALVPAEDRKLVEDRLREWDRLSRSQQTELLENEAIVHYLTELQSGSEEHKRRMQENISAPRREKLDRSIAQWQKLPPEQRNKIVVRFYQVFELPPEEQTKVLGTLSEPERQEIERTLRSFAGLPLEQRRLCLSSFEKLANLTPDDRLRFLKNAERWKLMSPNDRQAWRNLVKNLPPLPPGFNSTPPPPLPPGMSRPAAPQLTNGN
jgi:hypothetical protein